MFRSIRFRIALPFVLLILASMLGVGFYVSNYIRQAYIDDLKTNLLEEAQVIAHQLPDSAFDPNQNIDLNQIAREWSSLLGTRVTLIAADGQVLGESHDDIQRMDNHATRPEVVDAMSLGQGSSIRFSHTEGYDMLYAATSYPGSGKPTGIVRVALPLVQIQASLNQLRIGIISITLIAALIAILLAVWIASLTTRPIRELTAAAQRLSQGDFDTVIIPSTSDEVGELTQAFSHMGTRLSGQIEALETEHAKLSSIMDEMSDGVMLVDSHGVIQMVNPAAEMMFGAKAEDILNHTLIQALRQYQLVDLWEKSQKSDEPQIVLVDIPARNIYLQGVATRLGDAMPQSTMLLFQNLTRLRQLEKVRQDFITNISHELRTPLAAIKALSDTLQEGALDDPEIARRFLFQMDAEIDSLSLMVSELLELSRIESGEVPLKLQPTPPGEMITVAVERLMIQADRAGLSLKARFDEELPLVLVDRGRMEQVLVNLIHNAVKFTPEGGEILVTASQQEDNVWFSVEDTGTGIPTSDLDRIFERFYKTDKARSGGGTGLGLAISRHLVKAHGGKIWVESVEGRGSTFTFSVPVA